MKLGRVTVAGQWKGPWASSCSGWLGLSQMAQRAGKMGGEGKFTGMIQESDGGHEDAMEKGCLVPVRRPGDASFFDL